MSLFINNENQNLLWNIINKTDVFKHVFYSGSPNNPNIWFRNIIQKFYSEYPFIQKNDLNDLNKKVISFMIGILNQQGIESQGSHPQLLIQENPMQKSDVFNRQFMERQKEYETLLSKPTPPKPEFIDNIKDEAISNMDELLLKQKLIRDQDITALLPPQNKNVVISENNEIETLKIKVARIEEELMKFSEILQNLQELNSSRNFT